MHELMHVNYHRVHGKKDQNNPALVYVFTFVNAVQVPVQDSKYRQALKAQDITFQILTNTTGT